MNTNNLLLRILLLGSALLFFSACDEDARGWVGVDPGETPQESNYFGPGSVWELSLDDNDEFTLTKKNLIGDANLLLDIQGSYEDLDTGFTRLTLDSPVTGVHPEITALHIGTNSVILMPIETNNEHLVAVIQSDVCNSTNVRGNWLEFRFASGVETTNGTQTFFGTWEYNPTAGTLTFPSNYNLLPAYDKTTGQPLTSGTCSKGLSKNNNNSFYTNARSGVFSLNENDQNNHTLRFGMPAGEVVTLVNLNGDYVGMMYDSSSKDSRTVSATCSNGACEIFNEASITQINRTNANYELALDTPDALLDGFVTGDLTDLSDSDMGNIACMVNLNIHSQKNLLSCVGQQPDANSPDAVNIFLLSVN